MQLIAVNSKKECQVLRKGSAFTIEGLNTDEDSLNHLTDWINSYTKLLNKNFHIISGKNMNAWYKLTGDNAYPDDCNIVCIKLEDMEDAMAVALPRFQVGARWLDDIIDNNIRREREKKKKNKW